MKKLIGSQYIDSQFLWTHFFLSFWATNVTNFLKVMKLMSLLTCHLRLSNFVLETRKFEWQYLKLNPTGCRAMRTIRCYFCMLRCYKLVERQKLQLFPQHLWCQVTRSDWCRVLGKILQKPLLHNVSLSVSRKKITWLTVVLSKHRFNKF